MGAMFWIFVFIAVIIVGFVRKSQRIMRDIVTGQNDDSEPILRPVSQSDLSTESQISEEHISEVTDTGRYESLENASIPDVVQKVSDHRIEKRNHVKRAEEPICKEKSDNSAEKFSFDLRRAVIESEILNPKFKQY